MKRNNIAVIAFTVILIALFAILILHDSGEQKSSGLFMSYVDVILEEAGTGRRSFLAVSYSEYTKDLDPFKPDPMRVYTTGEGAFVSAADGRHVHNTLADGTLYDENGAPVDAPEGCGRILAHAAALDGPVDSVRIFAVGDRLFSQVTVSIDQWRNSLLYDYDFERDALIHLGSFQGQDIVGLRVPK